MNCNLLSFHSTLNVISQYHSSHSWWLLQYQNNVKQLTQITQLMQLTQQTNECNDYHMTEHPEMSLFNIITLGFLTVRQLCRSLDIIHNERTPQPFSHWQMCVRVRLYSHKKGTPAFSYWWMIAYIPQPFSHWQMCGSKTISTSKGYPCLFWLMNGSIITSAVFSLSRATAWGRAGAKKEKHSLTA